MFYISLDKENEKIRTDTCSMCEWAGAEVKKILMSLGRGSEERTFPILPD